MPFEPHFFNHSCQILFLRTCCTLSKNVSFQTSNIKQTALLKKKSKPSRNRTTFIVFLDIKRTCQRDKKINKPKKPTRAHRARSLFVFRAMQLKCTGEIPFPSWKLTTTTTTTTTTDLQSFAPSRAASFYCVRSCISSLTGSPRERR